MGTVLIACFSLVAALTVGMSTVVTLRVITEYLDRAMNERVARDMDLAQAFYQLEMKEITNVGLRMVWEPRVIENLPAAFHGEEDALKIIDQEIGRKITVPPLGSAHLIAVFDTEGKMLVARALLPEGQLSPLVTQGNWGE